MWRGLIIVILVFAGSATIDAKDWSDHMGEIPFVIGYDDGMEEARVSGKPAMLFFTATW